MRPRSILHHVPQNYAVCVWEINRNREKVKKGKETQTDESVFRSTASLFAQQKKIKILPQAQIPLKTKQAVTEFLVYISQ